jgi:hypothetical protein
MSIYPIDQLNPLLQKLLELATFEGEIQLTDSKGKLFSLKLLQENASPLDIPSLNLKLSTEEIVDTIREMREYHYT